MVDLTINIDEKTLERSREIARGRGISLDEFIAELLREVVATPSAGGADETLRLMKDARKQAVPWKFNRDEIYDV